MSDEEIARYLTLTTVDHGTGIFLQKYPVPLLNLRVSALWSFDTSVQRRLQEIRQMMHGLDNPVDRTYKLHYMSFSNLVVTSRALLSENLEGTAAFYAESAKQVVDNIVEIRV